jgi:hypothetical protein
MESWRRRCEKCVRLQGDYVEKWQKFQIFCMIIVWEKKSETLELERTTYGATKSQYNDMYVELYLQIWGQRAGVVLLAKSVWKIECNFIVGTQNEKWLWDIKQREVISLLFQYRPQKKCGKMIQKVFINSFHK